MIRAQADYQDADHHSFPLIEASRHLARISAKVTPSVVHIESKVESPERGMAMVEETGSGVIVSSQKVPGCYIVTNRHVIGDAADRLDQNLDPPRRRPGVPSHATLDRSGHRPCRAANRRRRDEARRLGG